MSNNEIPFKVPDVTGKYFIGINGMLLLEWTEDLSFFKVTSTPAGCELGPEDRKNLVLQLLSLVLPSE